MTLRCHCAGSYAARHVWHGDISQLKSEGFDLPVLMLTALGSLENRVEGLEAGADDYLVKPFDLAELWLVFRPSRGRSRKSVIHCP